MSRTLNRAVAVSLVVGLLSGAMVATPDDVVSAQETEPAPACEPGEVASLRDRFSKTFLNGDCSYTANIYGGSLNYKTSSGQWLPIENTLVPASGSDAVENAANAYSALLPADLSTPVVFEYKGDSLTFRLQGADGVRSVQANAASYPSALPGVDVTYETRSDYLKESLRLRSASATREFTFSLQPSLGLTPVQNTDESIDFVNTSGRVAFTMPAPFMYEESNEEIAGPVRYELTPATAGGYTLRLVPDVEWLADPARTFPVIVDPTLSPPYAGRDCHITNREMKDMSHCYYDRLRAGYSNGDLLARRAMLHFDVSSIPSNASVTSARLELYMEEEGAAGTNTTDVDLHRMTGAWSNSATWASLGGGSFNSTILDSRPLGSATGTKTWGATDLVQGWVNGTYTNYGMMIKQRTESVHHLALFTSIDNTVQPIGNRPRLVATYNVPPTTTGAPSDSPDPVLQGNAVTFKVPWSDSSMETVKAVVCKTNAISSGSCPGGAWATGGLSSQNPAEATFTTSTAYNGTYSYFVFACDNGNLCSSPRSDTTTPTFTVKPKPAAPTITSTSHPFQRTWSQNNDPSLSWAPLAGVDGYRTRLNQRTPTCGEPDQGPTTAASTSYVDVLDGQHCFSAAGVINGQNGHMGTYEIWVDSTPPGPMTPSCPTPPAGTTWIADDTPTISYPASEPTSPVTYHYEWDQAAGHLGVGTTSTSNSTSTMASSADGTWYFTVEAVNAAGGKSGPAGCTAKIDAVVPAPTVSSATHPDPNTVYESDDPAFSWTPPTTESGIAGYYYKLSASDVEPKPSSSTAPMTTSTTKSYVDVAAGPQHFHVWAKSNSGVWSEAGKLKIQIKDKGPVIDKVNCLSHSPSTTWFNDTTGDFSWSVLAGSAPSGVNGYSYDVTKVRLGPGPEDVSKTTSTSVSGVPLQQGLQWFRVKARNGNNLWGAPKDCELRVDTTKPPAPTAVYSSTHPQALELASEKVRMHWTVAKDHDAADPLSCTEAGGCSGAARYDYAFTHKSATPSWTYMKQTDSAARTSVEASLSQFVPAGADLKGAWYFHIRTRDIATNIGDQAATYGPFYYDKEGFRFPLAETIDNVNHLLFAQSDEMGLERFYAYRDFDLGSSTGYVNLKTGNLVVQDTDFVIPRAGLNAVIRHTYNSQRDDGTLHDEGLGTGWSLSVADGDAGTDGLGEAAAGIDLNAPIQKGRVVRDAGSGVLEAVGLIFEFTDGDGTTHRFVKESPTQPEWSSPPGVNLKLVEYVDELGITSRFELVRPDGVRYHIEKVSTGVGTFFKTWAVTAIQDRNQNRISFTYEAVDEIKQFFRGTRVRTVKDRSGAQVAEFVYATEGNTLQKIVATPGAASRENHFEVDPTTRVLRSVTDSFGTSDARTLGYTYEAFPTDLGFKQIMKAAKDGRQNATNFDVQQEGKKYRVWRVSDREQKAWTLDYGAGPRGNRLTTFTTPRGFPYRYLTSPRGQVASAKKALAGGNIVSIDDPGTTLTASATSGRFETRYIWDENRMTHVRQVINPATAPYSETNPATYLETTYRYNALGQLIEQTSPPTNADRSGMPSNASQGRLITRVAYEYSNAGGCEPPADDRRPLSPVGACSRTGDLSQLKVTDTGPTATGLPTATRVTDFDHDVATGNLLIVKSIGDASHADRHYSMSYNPDGTLKTLDGPRGASDADLAGPAVNDVTTFLSYDVSGQPEQIQDAFGNITTYDYNAFGNVTLHEDRERRATTYDYDALNNVKSTTAASATTPLSRTTSYAWDENDNLSSVKTPAGRLTERLYDRNDRLIEVKTPGANVGDVQTKTKLDYYSDGLLQTEYLPVAASIASPPVSRSYLYFGGGLVRRISEATTGGSFGESWLSYDALGRLIRTEGPWNGSGVPTVEMSYAPSGAVTRRLERSSSGGMDRETQYAYSAFGEEVEQLMAPNNATGLRPQTLSTYSPFGELEVAKRRKSSGVYVESSYGYDRAGNLKRSVVPGPQGPLESLFKYDALGRLRAQTKDPVNATHTVSFDYDKDGLQVSRVDKATGVDDRVTTWLYNADRTLRSTSASQGTKLQNTTCYFKGTDPGTGYDADGNLVYSRSILSNASCGDASESTVRRDEAIVLDGRGWVSSATHRVRSPQTDQLVSRSESATFDRAGRLTRWTFDGRDTLYAPSDGGYVTQMTDWRSNADDRVSRFTYMASGQLATANLGNSAVRGSFDYHADGSLRNLWWRPKLVDEPLRSHTSLGYFTDGSLRSETVKQVATGTSDTGGDASYTYDVLGRLQTWTSPFELQTSDLAPPVTNYTLLDSGDVDLQVTTVSGSQRKREDFRFADNKLDEVAYEPADPAALVDITNYNGFGEETQRSAGDRKATTTYDSAGHVASITDDPTPTSTDGRGIAVSYRYDLEDRVLSRSLSQEAGGATTASPRHTINFHSVLFDRAVLETDGKGGDLARYLMTVDGRHLAQQTFDRTTAGDASTTLNPTWTWLLWDPHGNVATLVSDSGGGVTAVTRQKNYDPYGRIDPRGSGPQDADGPFGTDVPDSSYGYNDELTDSATGRLLVGPRQYDPSLNRFASADVYAGATADLSLATDPLTGNRYIWAGANPVAFYDDGHRPLAAPHQGSSSHGCKPADCPGHDDDVRYDGNPPSNPNHAPFVRIAEWVPVVGTGIEGYRCISNGGWGCLWVFGSAIPGAKSLKYGDEIVDTARRAFGLKTAVRSCAANSFTARTRVLMADGSTKKIKKVQVGDLVWAKDPVTGEAGPRRVTNTIVGDGKKKLVDVAVDGATITATDGHPFWVEDEGRWINAVDLQRGNRLVLPNGTTVGVDALAARTAVLTVHNLTVNGIHTYYVMAGDDAVLVHNCNITSKIRSQMAARGWTDDLISRVQANPDFTRQVWDLGADAPATAYARSYNEYVVLNDLTGDVIQISDQTDYFWKPVWSDPKFSPR